MENDSKNIHPNNIWKNCKKSDHPHIGTHQVDSSTTNNLIMIIMAKRNTRTSAAYVLSGYTAWYHGHSVIV